MTIWAPFSLENRPGEHENDVGRATRERRASRELQDGSGDGRMAKPQTTVGPPWVHRGPKSAGKAVQAGRVLHSKSRQKSGLDLTRLPGGGGYIDDACGDSPPPPGDPRLGAFRSSAGELREQKRTESRDWGQIGTVRFVAESTGCG